MVNPAGRLARAAFVSVKASADAAEVRRSVKIDLEVTRVRTAAAGAILEAIGLARQGQIAQAQARIAAAAAAVRSAVARLKNAELGDVIRELEEVGKQLAQLVAPAPQVTAHGHRGGAPQALDALGAPAMAPPAVERKLRRMQEKASAAVSGEH
jgi:hypothetical protein